MRRARRVVVWLLALPLILFLVYLVVVNAALNLSIGRRLMNSHPEVVQITFTRAWTLWPGHVHVTSAVISGQDTGAQFQITADDGEITFQPRGFSHKLVTGNRLRGHGMTVRVRMRRRTMPSDEELARLPAIRGFPSPLMDPGPYVRPTAGGHIQDIDVQHVREVWIEDYRFTGDLDVKGGFLFGYVPQRATRVYPVHLAIHEGAMTTGGRPVVHRLRGTIEGNVEQLQVDQAGLDAMGRVSARIHLSARTGNIRFLNYYLRRAPQVKLDGGAGDLVVELRVDHGKLVAPGHIGVRSPRVVLVLPYFDAGGSGHVRFRVNAEQQRTDLAVDLGQVVLVQRSDGKPCMRGRTIHVAGHTADLDLAHPPELELRVDLPEATAGDLTFLNHYIPDSTPAEVMSGAGKLAGHFHLRTADNLLDGMADIVGSDLAVQNRSAHIRGAARVHGVLKRLDLKTLAYDLTGSYLVLDDVLVRVDGRETPHWRARVDLDAFTGHPRSRQRADAMLRVQVKDLEPVMSVVSANVKLPWMVKALADRSDVHARARLRAGETTIGLSGIEAITGALRVHGELHFTDLQRKAPGKEGVLLVQWHALAVGLEINDDSTHVVTWRPTRWYEQQRVAPEVERDEPEFEEAPP